MKSIKKRIFSIIIAALAINTTMKLTVFAEMPTKNRSFDILFTIIVTATIWYGNIAIYNYLDKKADWVKAFKKRLILQILLILVYSSTVIFALIFIYNSTIYCGGNGGINSVKQATIVGLIASVLIMLIEIAGIFFHNWKNSLVEVERYKTESTQAQLQNLKNQINPHFLFNNLSVLSGLVYENQDKSVEFINQLAKVYRYILDNRNMELVSLAEELESLKSYNYLLMIRFGDGLQIKYDILDQLTDKLLPPLCLQMLVENVIKHNEINKEKPLVIKIASHCNRVSVINDIQPRIQLEESTKTGLTNIQARYAFFTDEKITIEKGDHIFSVTLPLLNRL